MDKLLNEFSAIRDELLELQSKDDYTKSLELLQPFADKGLAIAQHFIGTFHYFGRSIPVDYKKAAEWLTKAADQNEPNALSMLGHLYLRGFGVSKNVVKGIELVNKAIQLECYYGFFVLGNYYASLKKEESINEAAYWYIEGIKRNNIDSIRALSALYYDRKMYEKALQLLLMGVKLGCLESSFNAACMIDEGLGCEKDPQMAFDMLEIAAQSGHVQAKHNLGTFFYNGQVVKQDKNKALELYLESANKGNSLSQHSAGLMYFNGDLPQDLDVSLAWFRKALENGHKASARFIEEIELIQSKKFTTH